MKTQMTNYPRVLIVGTTPYNPSESSRALDTYFHNWPKENLRMIFSNANTPVKGHCGSLFQLTDHELLKNFFNKNRIKGKIYNYEDLSDISITDNSLSKFKSKNSLRYYLRKILWSNNRWKCEPLLKWVDEFKPEIIYICFSDDYFILDIAKYFAKKYNAPIIAQIGDDYYFKKHNVFLNPYFKSYKRLFDELMNTNGFGVYISDKLADKYNSYFKLQGFPFYLSSAIKNENKPIIKEFNYIGKLEPNRHLSLGLLANALNKIDDRYHINVYSSTPNKNILNYFKKHHIEYKGFVQYDKAIEIINSGAFNIIASSFNKKDIEITRYSLSTKVSDSLASCGPIIAIGPEGDGAIDFLKEKECAIVLNNEVIDINQLKIHINNDAYLEKIINKSKTVYNELFDTCKNRSTFEKQCSKILN